MGRILSGSAPEILRNHGRRPAVVRRIETGFETVGFPGPAEMESVPAGLLGRKEGLRAKGVQKVNGHPEPVAAIATDYLERVKAQLGSVPAREQDEFLREISLTSMRHTSKHPTKMMRKSRRAGRSRRQPSARLHIAFRLQVKHAALHTERPVCGLIRDPNRS